MNHDDYYHYRCCMCPQIGVLTPVCPGISHTPHPTDTPCTFINQYEDSNGWQYFVRGGIGQVYKTFYIKPGSRSQKGCRMTKWTPSIDEAQTELNKLAEKKGWQRVQHHLLPEELKAE